MLHDYIYNATACTLNQTIDLQFSPYFSISVMVFAFWGVKSVSQKENEINNAYL